MKFSLTKVIALIIVLIIPLLYLIMFGFHLGLPFSESQDEWAQFGDYFGGIINPLLSFITIVLLIESLSLQNKANLSLVKQLNQTEKNESLKIFENLFFHLISVQNEQYKNFRIIFITDEGKQSILFGAEAVDKIERTLDSEISSGSNFTKLSELYDIIDDKYGVYDLLRTFCIGVSLIQERLCDENGFLKEDRYFYYEKLINLTEFSHLRLLQFALQFETNKSIEKLKNEEFQNVCNNLKLKIFNAYDLK